MDKQADSKFNIDITGLPGYSSFEKLEPITGGWSKDRKFRVSKKDGTKALLRVTDVEFKARKLEEFEYMKRVAAEGIPISVPLEFGECGGGLYVYQILEWCDGENLDAALPKLSPEAQRATGELAGDIQRRINTMEEYPPSPDWGEGYNKSFEAYINDYLSCDKKLQGAEYIIDYIRDNREVIANRPTCLSHNDFHVGNFMRSPDGSLRVIDFEAFRAVDPYWTFKSASYNLMVSTPFVAGQIRSYFKGDPPSDFWPIFKLYLAAMGMNMLPNAVRGVENNFGIRTVRNILTWFDNMKSTTPTWY